MCEHVSTRRQSAGHIFLAALLPDGRACTHMHVGVRVCSSVLFLHESTCVCTTRHQGVLIYSNEPGRITRGWGEGRRRCVQGGTFFGWRFISPFLSPPHTCFFSHLQMRLFAWLRRREARETEEKDDETEKEKGKNWRWGERCDSEADRAPADKNTPCQGDITASKMAAAGGVLCGTNLETRCSRSTVGDTQTHFLTSTVLLKHNEENEIRAAQ